MTLKEGIGKKLKRIRKERGITQKVLAEKIEGKIDYTYIGKIERGEQLPSLKMLKKIGDALSIPLSYFFYDEEVAKLFNFLPKEAIEILRDEKKKDLLRTFNIIHGEDIPFIVEIINILGRHREISSRPKSTFGERDKYLRVAEGKEEYGKRERINRLTSDIKLLIETLEDEDEKLKDVLKRTLRELMNE
ncbi:MAG: helix-turn-helix domain-containing protein [Thermodesulfobacteriota bacterium]